MGTPEGPRPPNPGRSFAGETLDPRHFYAAYSFDTPETRQNDITALIAEAQRLGYPVRYWWLSDAMDLYGEPDRLIVCVHHPTRNENAGIDLFDALKAKGATWDDLENAAIEEYMQFSRRVRGAGEIVTPDDVALFPALALEHPTLREMDTLVALTFGDVQSIAVEALGRELTDTELSAVTTHVQEYLESKVTLLVTTMEPGEETPLLQATDPTATTALAPEAQTRSEYLVYYRLTGMTLAQAPHGRAASQAVYDTLQGLIGKLGEAGMTPQEASPLRLSNLDVFIESVEALEFPTNAPIDQSLPNATPHAEPAPSEESFDLEASISRADLEEAGFDTQGVTEADMKRLARQMTADYFEQLYRSSLKTHAEAFGIPKRQR